MSPYRLIAIDLDGTLLNHEGKVSEANKLAIRRALEAGFRVVFATGRNYYESLPVIDEIGHYDAAVFVGGATVVDTRGGETLHRQLIEPEIAREVCALIEGYGIPPLVYQDRKTAGHDFILGPASIPEVLMDWYRRHEAQVRKVDDLAEVDHAETLRIGTLGPAPLIAAVEAALEARFGERLFFHRIRLGETGAELLEIFDPSVNKWAGIQHVAERHGIAQDEIVAVGDDMNDLHMIRHAGLGVAMGNARPQIKEIADRVIGSHAEDGLAAFLDELVRSQADASRP